MSPWAVKEALDKGIPLFGLWNILTKEWALDCFDYVRLFANEIDAHEFKTICSTYNCDTYEIKLWDDKESFCK